MHFSYRMIHGSLEPGNWPSVRSTASTSGLVVESNVAKPRHEVLVHPYTDLTQAVKSVGHKFNGGSEAIETRDGGVIPG